MIIIILPRCQQVTGPEMQKVGIPGAISPGPKEVGSLGGLMEASSLPEICLLLADHHQPGKARWAELRSNIRDCICDRDCVWTIENWE